MNDSDRKKSLQELLKEQTRIETTNEAKKKQMLRGCEELIQFINDGKVDKLLSVKKLGVDFSYIKDFDKERCMKESDYGFNFRNRVSSDIDLLIRRFRGEE